MHILTDASPADNAPSRPFWRASAEGQKDALAAQVRLGSCDFSNVAFREFVEELIALLPRLGPAGAGSSVSFAPPPLTPPPAKVSLRS